MVLIALDPVIHGVAARQNGGGHLRAPGRVVQAVLHGAAAGLAGIDRRLSAVVLGEIPCDGRFDDGGRRLFDGQRALPHFGHEVFIRGVHGPVQRHAGEFHRVAAGVGAGDGGAHAVESELTVDAGREALGGVRLAIVDRRGGGGRQGHIFVPLGVQRGVLEKGQPGPVGQQRVAVGIVGPAPEAVACPHRLLGAQCRLDAVLRDLLFDAVRRAVSVKGDLHRQGQHGLGIRALQHVIALVGAKARDIAVRTEHIGHNDRVSVGGLHLGGNADLAVPVQRVRHADDEVLLQKNVVVGLALLVSGDIGLAVQLDSI